MAITKDGLFIVEKNQAAWVRVVLTTAAGVPATGKVGTDLTVANRWQCDGNAGVTAMGPAAGHLVEKSAVGAPGEYDFQLQADDTNFDGEVEFYVAEAGGAFFRGKVLCVTATASDRVLANGTAIAALPDAAASQAAAEAAIIAQAVSTLTTDDIPTDEDNAVAVLEKLIADHKAVDGSVAFFVNRIAAAVRGYYKMDTDGTYAVKDDAGATVDGGTYKNPDGEGSDSAIVERVPDDLPE